MKIKCIKCGSHAWDDSGKRIIRRAGRFWRKSSGHWIQRFCCFRCGKTFSSAAMFSNYRQKKRHKNESVRKLLSGGVSQREAARILNLNRKTVVRKFLYLAGLEDKALADLNKKSPRAIEVEFDDLETFEHTRCKPLSVSLMVEYQTRRILGFEVSQMPAKGKLSALAKKKYGFRADKRGLGRKLLFQRMNGLIADQAIIRSDSNPHYPAAIKVHFPNCLHETVISRKAAITGQGELKKTKFDPIFSLNHTCAMLRANINRLFRKTWCTTKRADRLSAHLAIYCMSHNRRLSTA